MHPDPDAFMSTVSTVHEAKAGSGLLNKTGVKVDLKTESKSKKGGNRRTTLLPSYTPPDYTQSDGETENYNSQKIPRGNKLHKVSRPGERQSDRQKGVTKELLAL